MFRGCMLGIMLSMMHAKIEFVFDPDQDLYRGVSINRGTPNGWFIRDNPIYGNPHIDSIDKIKEPQTAANRGAGVTGSCAGSKPCSSCKWKIRHGRRCVAGSTALSPVGKGLNG